MSRVSRLVCCAALLAAVVIAVPAVAGDLTAGMTTGTPDIQSAGPIAFAPEGILLLGDSNGAAVFAIDTGDKGPRSAGAPTVRQINVKVAGVLGATTRDIRINDLAVNPASGSVYLSVARGQGPSATAALVKVSTGGDVEAVSLENVKFAKASVENAPAPDAVDRRRRPLRAQSITDLEFVDGKVLVAGLSTEEFSSRLRVIPLPFSELDRGTGVGIYHGSHGRFETASPIRTFTHYNIGGAPHILAAYTCTPLVKFSLSDLKPGADVKGATVAELGNRNNPLDMFVYNKDGKDYVLMANSSRGLMKITTENISGIAPITEADGRVPDKAGLTYDTIVAGDSPNQVLQLDRFDDTRGVVLVRNADNGAMNLRTYPLP